LRAWADRDAATHTGVVTAKAAGLHHERRRFARLLAQDAPSPTTLRELADAEAAAGDGPRARNALRRAISLVRMQNDAKTLAELTERLRVLKADPGWSGPGQP
jgi:Tfp pilus assembly protein PilF